MKSRKTFRIGGASKLLLLIFATVAGVTFWILPRFLEPVSVGESVAPHPAEYTDAVVQVYGANVWGLRGRFAIHTWIATKAENAANYTIYQVIGWRLRRHGSVVSISQGPPDKPWFGSEPVLLLDRRGDTVRDLVASVDEAARSYPFSSAYSMWPGPNSNSFTAWVGLQVPALELDLPFKALGKGWMEANYEETLTNLSSDAQVIDRT